MRVGCRSGNNFSETRSQNHLLPHSTHPIPGIALEVTHAPPPSIPDTHTELARLEEDCSTKKKTEEKRRKKWREKKKKEKWREKTHLQFRDLVNFRHHSTLLFNSLFFSSLLFSWLPSLPDLPWPPFQILAFFSYFFGDTFYDNYYYYCYYYYYYCYDYYYYYHYYYFYYYYFYYSFLSLSSF